MRLGCVGMARLDMGRSNSIQGSLSHAGMGSQIILEKTLGIRVIKWEIQSYVTNGAWQAQCDIGITTVKTPSHRLSHALNMKS